MKRRSSSVRLALAALAIVGLAVRAGAQAPPTLVPATVPFKTTVLGTQSRQVLPTTPVIVGVRTTGTGQAAFLGKFEFVSHALHKQLLDGKPSTITDGIGVFTATTGDALFIKYIGLVHPATTKNAYDVEGAFQVTGGKGQFLGARGSGTFSAVEDGSNKLAVAFIGLISPPTPGTGSVSQPPTTTPSPRTPFDYVRATDEPGASQPTTVAPPQQVAFRATMEFAVPNPHIVLGEPPLVSTNTVAVGDSTFGRYAFTDHHFAVAGAFLSPVSAADGVGVFSWANGDQLFISFNGLYRGQTSPGVFPVDGFYTLTGGRGRFAGATGSGTFTAVVDANKNFVTRVFEGTVSAPKQ